MRLRFFETNEPAQAKDDTEDYDFSIGVDDGLVTLTLLDSKGWHRIYLTETDVARLGFLLGQAVVALRSKLTITTKRLEEGSGVTTFEAEREDRPAGIMG